MSVHPLHWALSIDFGDNHPFAVGIYAIGADDSLHLDRMVYERKVSDEQRKNRVKDLIGDTKLDFQIGDSEDPLAIDTLNRQLKLKIQPVVKGAGSVLEGINKSKSLLFQNRFIMDPSCEDLAWEKEN
ncbi:hypothetical protein HQO42_13750 [Rhodococcus fascians]|nr:hypothetical protein [Rhodococcus fascians]MBY4239548.1 hypothetical protein [Rhodococcus fascians]MBY4253720.1 hypothetical protein [Rhodococcus fascians]MBY4271137.1 hypothetical protein [Rhodococcus fascians]